MGARPRTRPLLALALLVLGATASCSRRASTETSRPSEAPLPVVEVGSVHAEPLREIAELVGELRADESVLARSELAGIVEHIEFTEGEAVTTGETLFRLRDGEQRARLREAEAREALAADEYRRTQRLAKQNATAEAQLERARAELEVERARVDLARVELERTRIRAPFDGVAGSRLVSPGARITPETNLVRIDAIAPLQVLFSVAEWGAPLVRVGVPISVQVAAYPNDRFAGEVFFVDPSVDRQTRRLLLKGRLPNEDGRLRPGMFAQVRVEIAERDALLVPEEAVVHDRTGTFVWRVDEEGVTERVPVETGTHQDGRVEIRSGLRDGDRVVFAGTNKVLFAGARVEAVAPPEASAEGEGLAVVGAPAGEGG